MWSVDAEDQCKLHPGSNKSFRANNFSSSWINFSVRLRLRCWWNAVCHLTHTWRTIISILHKWRKFTASEKAEVDSHILCQLFASCITLRPA